MTVAEQGIYTHYANTDLEIGSDREPLELAAIFYRHQFFNMTEQTLEDGTWLGRYETGEQYTEPDSNMAGFLDVIEDLHGTALKEWQQCTRREFDIGYEAGHEPFCFNQMLTVETLTRAVKAGFIIRLTIYAAARKDAPAPSTRTRFACKRLETG